MQQPRLRRGIRRARNQFAGVREQSIGLGVAAFIGKLQRERHQRRGGVRVVLPQRLLLQRQRGAEGSLRRTRIVRQVRACADRHQRIVLSDIARTECLRRKPARQQSIGAGVGGDRIRARHTGQHADRAFHDLCRRQHAVGIPHVAVHQRDQGDMAPATHPLRALQQLGGLSAENGGGDRWFAEEPRLNACAPWAVRGQSRKVAGRAGAARADPGARLLPRAAEDVGALAGPRRLRAIFAHRVLADRHLRGGFAPDCLRALDIRVTRRLLTGQQQHRYEQRQHAKGNGCGHDQ